MVKQTINKTKKNISEISIIKQESSSQEKNEDKSIDLNISEIKNVKQDSILDKINFFFIKISKVPIREKLFFVQHLSLMLRVGISLSKALRTVALQSQSKYFVYILIEMAKKIENGANFSDSLKPYKNVFGELFINMIEAGETSGKLEEVLKELFIQMKKEHAILSKVRGALTYPAVILIAMLGIGTFMITVIVPRITANFIEMNVELPLPTKILIGVSNAIIHNGVFVLITLLILIILFVQTLKTKKGKSFFDLLFLKLPIIAPIIKKINIARFARNISSLLKTDIMIVKSFEITSSVLGNTHYKNAVLEMGMKLKKGEGLTETIKNYPKLFPPVIVQMVSIGEETGDLDDILIELAEFYEGEIDQIMTDLPALIEPILILILGVGVGGVAISIIMPMYSITAGI
jgi:type IV pilus assembly protein PilC